MVHGAGLAGPSASRRRRHGEASTRTAERRTSSGGPRRSSGGTGGHRLLAVRLDRAQGATQAGRSRRGARATPSRRRRSPCCGTATTTRPGRGRRPDRRRALSLDATCPASARTSPSTSATRSTRRCARTPTSSRPSPPAGITDMSLVLIDVWTYGKALMPEQCAGPASGLVRRLAARRLPAATRTPTRSPGLKFIVDMNTMELLEIEDDHDVGSPDVQGEYIPGIVDRRAAHRSQTAAHHPARGRLVHGRGHRAALAELVDATGVQLPRGPGHLPGRLRRPRRRPRRRLPAVLRRDGRPLPRLLVRPLPAHRLRRRRVGPGLHDHLARARLRLSRRDRLRRRGAARQHGRAVRHLERDLPPRGGQRGPLEARRRQHRRRGPPDAPAWSSPATSPWPTTSTSSTGASTRTATSSARYAPPGSW